MTSKPIFQEAHITEAAEAIAEALRPHIANKYQSTVNEAVAKVPAYHRLNNGETHLALVRALTVLQQETLTKFAALLYDEGDDDLESALEVIA